MQPPAVPEIWLNYGSSDVVVDVRAENLGETITGGQADALEGEALEKEIDGMIDLSAPSEMAVLHSTPAVHRLLNAVLDMCSRRSVAPPRIVADRWVAAPLRAALTEGARVESGAVPAVPGGGGGGEGGDAGAGRTAYFVAEAELDGLFGYETVASRLARRFGRDEAMLAAYAKRRGPAPAPGEDSDAAGEARQFADRFEVRAVDIVAGPAGISHVRAGHPSETSKEVPRLLEAAAVRDGAAGRHRSLIASTGKAASNDTLVRSLSSLWNCRAAVPKGGLVVLLAECGRGTGAEALQRFVEGRLDVSDLRRPSRYIDGMEALLFLEEAKRDIQVGIVSVMPDLYTKRLGLVPLAGARAALDYTLSTMGQRHKVSVLPDAARSLLR